MDERAVGLDMGVDSMDDEGIAQECQASEADDDRGGEGDGVANDDDDDGQSHQDSEDEGDDDDDDDNEGDEAQHSDEEDGGGTMAVNEEVAETLDDLPLPTALSIEAIRGLPNRMVGDDHSYCVICASDMSARETITTLPCNHRYHEDCLTPWLLRAGTCPTCRRIVPQRVGHRQITELRNEERQQANQAALIEARISLDWEALRDRSMDDFERMRLEEDLDDL
ncbi:Ring finger domain-containing protein 7 [Elsinoe fawcettii]|nr:Ring finger domain-containing protein 7 [Elsinoe fawcettii]